jgi:hypothetical protein
LSPPFVCVHDAASYYATLLYAVTEPKAHSPMNTSLSRFELIAGELRTIGLTLQRLPGEYRVNFRNSGGASCR